MQHSIQQLIHERNIVLQETNNLITQIQTISEEQKSLKEYKEEVERRLGLFREKMESLWRNEFERCPNDVLLEIFSKVDSFECLGRLKQSCKRFRSLINSNKDRVWEGACLAWWRLKVKKGDSSLLKIAHEHGERDWEWIARCFARDQENSLSFRLMGGENKRFELKFGTMEDKNLSGWGVKIKGGVVDIGHFENKLSRGKRIDKGSGYSYEGQFKNGEQHGFGTATSKDGTYYQGEWKIGLKQGLVTHTFNACSRRIGGMESRSFRWTMDSVVKVSSRMENPRVIDSLFSHSDRDLFVHPRVKECLSRGVCTDTLGKEMPQFFMRCRECNIHICLCTVLSLRTHFEGMVLGQTLWMWGQVHSNDRDWMSRYSIAFGQTNQGVTDGTCALFCLNLVA